MDAGETKVAVVLRATRHDEVLIFDLDHYDAVPDQGIGLSVESSTEGRKLDRFRLERTVREERFWLFVVHVLVSYADGEILIHESVFQDRSYRNGARVDPDVCGKHQMSD